MEKSQKRRSLTLAQYVHRRNGVPLGASGSLSNMLYRSLGAGSFTKFWQYWNPIWGYALGRFIYFPLKQYLPAALALILTFTISGVIHDFATMLIRQSGAFLFTPWFFLMGVVVIIEQIFQVDYSKQQRLMRVVINLIYVLSCLAITLTLKHYITSLSLT